MLQHGQDGFGDQAWSGGNGALDPTPLFDPAMLPSLKTLRVFDAHDHTAEAIRGSKLAKHVKPAPGPLW